MESKKDWHPLDNQLSDRQQLEYELWDTVFVTQDGEERLFDEPHVNGDRFEYCKSPGMRPRLGGLLVTGDRHAMPFRGDPKKLERTANSAEKDYLESGDQYPEDKVHTARAFLETYSGPYIVKFPIGRGRYVGVHLPIMG